MFFVVVLLKNFHLNSAHECHLFIYTFFCIQMFSMLGVILAAGCVFPVLGFGSKHALISFGYLFFILNKYGFDCFSAVFFVK